LEVSTIFGFKRHFVEPDFWDSRDGFRIKRQAFNTKIQNPAACLTYVSMIWLEEQMRERNLRSVLFGQVHDSVLVDVAPGEEDVVYQLIRESMDNVAAIAEERYGVKIGVPLECDLEAGPSWGSTEPVL
jgi:DNA polymerase-1